jgi:hypothetical protein
LGFLNDKGDVFFTDFFDDFGDVVVDFLVKLGLKISILLHWSLVV